MLENAERSIRLGQSVPFWDCKKHGARVRGDGENQVSRSSSRHTVLLVKVSGERRSWYQEPLLSIPSCRGPHA